ncbi:MAG: DEAD/DEAH box helicase [Anaerolineae bacterium]|nr:DEAD/DEAH box helicase [Anaerolineae bacterium]
MNITTMPEKDGLQNLLANVSLDQLSEPLRAAATRAGWTQLMPVQASAIPYLLAGREMMIQARTGSGKTGAYLLPMLECLDPTQDQCQALVLTPTRELAHQVTGEAELLCGPAGFRTVAVYGGVGYGPQSDVLRKGAHIVIGTPGRVLDHLLKRTFTLKHLRMLVFDEADRMLSMGFYPDMREVQRYLPEHSVHTCMFSATFPPSVLRTARQFIQEPEFLSLSSDHVHVTETEHVYYTLPEMEKDRGLVRLIEVENPASAIIFCNTKMRVHYVTVVLQRFGYDADELSSDLSQKDRERVLKRVRQGKLRFLVATDVAARGIDIPDLSHVILYELPEDIESYIHRAGRTGRAGAAGVAISLVGLTEEIMLKRIMQHYKIDMEARQMPTDDDVAGIVTERLIALLEARLRARDKLQAERSRRFASLARSLAEDEEGLEIITMLLDDDYQQMLHAPVPQPADEPLPVEFTAAPTAGTSEKSSHRRSRRR